MIMDKMSISFSLSPAVLLMSSKLQRSLFCQRVHTKLLSLLSGPSFRQETPCDTICPEHSEVTSQLKTLVQFARVQLRIQMREAGSWEVKRQAFPLGL